MIATARPRAYRRPVMIALSWPKLRSCRACGMPAAGSCWRSSSMIATARLDEGADVVYADFRRKRQKAWKNLGSWLNGKVAEWVLNKPRGLYLSPYKVIR